jgi:dihydrofolate reductase
MARFVFALNQSLDGYVDHDKFRPDVTLFRHFTDTVANLAGSIYGRRMYETMRYWDGEDARWDADERAFAHAWRGQPKWVVSGTLTSVGPNATLVRADFRDVLAELRRTLSGEVQVCGPQLAHALTEGGLIDEYRIYLHPVVLGAGKPFFAGPRPPLRLAASERIGPEVIRLTYVPA